MSQFNINQFNISLTSIRRCWAGTINKAGIELYMSFGGKAALKVEEVVINANSMSDISKMWNALDRAFLYIDHLE